MPDLRFALLARYGASFCAYAAVAALVCLPLALERSVETARFHDRLGTFPVEVSLAHNGTSTLDTGVLGRIYWSQTGPGGFGLNLRSVGPPAAEGTLSSYVTPRFLRTNAAFVDDPDRVADLYTTELRSRVLHSFVQYEAVAAGLGGLVLVLLFRGRPPPVPALVRSRPGRWLVRVGYLLVLTVLCTGIAWQFFGSWSGARQVAVQHPMPGEPRLSFSSPQTLEVARQVRPFVEKNQHRIEERTASFVTTATANLRSQLALHESRLVPQDGELVVVSEADPQGSNVATRLRRELYPLLRELLGDGAIAFRTISGDVTANGTVAEQDFVSSEVDSSAEIPTVVVKGDHDTRTTVEQLEAKGVTTPDLEVEEVSGLAVVGADDPAFKALFGGLVVNPSGTTETELGQELRAVVDDWGGSSGIDVLLHQPRATWGYLGITSRDDLEPTLGHETTPYDDGIPDVPPGMVNYGHLHDADGPWVLWNTDDDQITWTVVSQLGTSGGVEENPTFNRFSTPFSVPLKDISVRLAYVNPDSGLQTGYASITVHPDGDVVVDDRVDVGLPGGLPGAPAE